MSTLRITGIILNSGTYNAATLLHQAQGGYSVSCPAMELELAAGARMHAASKTYSTGSIRAFFTSGDFFCRAAYDSALPRSINTRPKISLSL